MDRILQAQENALNSFQQNIQAGTVSGVYLVFTGTNSTTAKNDFSLLGNITVKRNGTTLVNRPTSLIAQKNDILAGSNLIDDTDSGAIIAVTFLPFYVKGYKQALNITDPSELNFEYIPSAGASAQYSALNLQVFSVVEQLPEAYDYFLLGDDQSESGGVTSKPYQLNQKNIAGVYLTDPDDVLTSAGLRQNGKQVQSEQPLALLQGATLTENELETSTQEMIRFKQYTDGNPASLFNADTVLLLTLSGAGSVTVTRESIIEKR